MVRKTANFILLLSFGLLLFFLHFRFPDLNIQKGYATAFSVAGSYFLFKILFDEFLISRISASKTRYSLKKATSLFLLIVLIIITLRIWLPNAQALLVSYGLVAAGVAIALQDVFKNIMGGIIVFINRLYQVGDRIEINGKSGDVIDIDMFYTSLLEIQEWVAGDQATGRIITVPNGVVLAQNVHNYTKDHNFIWDEIMLPVTYTSDWKKAVTLIKAVVTKETLEITKKAENEFTALEQRYFVSKRNVEPDVFLTPTDNWITFHIRYITPVRERRIYHNKLVQLILEVVEANSTITIASTTMNLVGLQAESTSRPVNSKPVK